MDDIEKLLQGEQDLIKRSPCTIYVNDKVYNVKQISNAVRSRIANLEKEAFILNKENEQGVTLRRAKKIDKKIRTLHSKTAAYYLLNNVALFFPFVYWIKWRRLDMMDSEYTFRINEAGMGNKGMDFFLANWQITKAQLALSTRLVGDGINQFLERKESAENMLAQDASGVKKE